MPRTPEQIWTDLNLELTRNAETALAISKLQAEMNYVAPEPGPDPEPEPGPDPEPEPVDALPKHPPKATDAGVEASPSTLQESYRSLKDGQTLWLVDGNYGDFTFDRKFDKGVVIRSKNSLKAKITGRWYFYKGEGHWLYDTWIATPVGRLNSQSGAIVFNSEFTATKNKVDTVCGMYGISNPDPNDCGSAKGPLTPAHDFYIGWNDFVGRNAGGMESASHIKLRCWVGASTPTPEFRDFAIYDNAFYDPDKGNTGTDATYNFYVGDTKCYYPDSYCFPNGLIFENVALSGNNRRFLYFKRGVAKVHNNLCLGARGTAFTQRYGFDTQWWGNKDARVADESAIFAGGRGPNYSNGATDIRGNDFCGSVIVRCGTSSNGAMRTPALDYGLMVGNKAGKVTTIGKRARDDHPLDPKEGGKLDHFTLINHIGNVTVIDINIDKDSCNIAPNAGPGNYYVPPVTTVKPDEVGLKG